jgi:hypothetical protein
VPLSGHSVSDRQANLTSTSATKKWYEGRVSFYKRLNGLDLMMGAQAFRMFAQKADTSFVCREGLKPGLWETCAANIKFQLR